VTIDRFPGALWVPAWLLLAAGCGQTPEKLFPVSGTVTVGGQPMQAGTIQFEMVERGQSGKRYTSTGEIDEQGNYELTTFGRRGAPAGQHRVWVTPLFAHLPDELGTGIDRLTPIPDKYMMPTSTDLTFEVQPGDNRIDVDVPLRNR
jgi:hypothetical protein